MERVWKEEKACEAVEYVKEVMRCAPTSHTPVSFCTIALAHPQCLSLLSTHLGMLLNTFLLHAAHCR